MTYADTSQIPPELESLVQSELQRGERVTWLEQPIPRLLGRKALPLVLFGIPWTAFALFWTAGAAWAVWRAEGSGPAFFFPLFGLPFIAIGAGMLSSPFWLRRSARRSVYVLTDKRAIVFRAGWRGSVTVQSFEPAGLTDLQRRQHKDGSGDLVFAREINIRRRGSGDRYANDVGFLGVSDVKSVEDLVRALARKGGQE